MNPLFLSSKYSVLIFLLNIDIIFKFLKMILVGSYWKISIQKNRFHFHVLYAKSDYNLRDLWVLPFKIDSYLNILNTNITIKIQYHNTTHKNCTDQETYYSISIYSSYSFV